ncbi:MAG TPA: FAD-binding oxidoreductase [Spirochaetia bacterium]|nr:FAD-binding oxidoreductase [Spirochaetia bacterium]
MAETIQTPKSTTPRVHEVRELTSTTYVLRFDRNGMEFAPGQYVSVGLKGDINMREYSIYSPVEADYLEILVREVDEGYVSRLLRGLRPGDELEVDGPFGFFLIDEKARGRRFLFIATGTGISPFHCLTGSYPDLDYELVHGVRTGEERYEHAWYDRSRVTSCLSRDPDEVARAGSCDDGAPEHAKVVAGRVTEYLRDHPVDPDTLCYLCGNCDMIYEAFDILKSHGVAPEQLYAEVYF